MPKTVRLRIAFVCNKSSRRAQKSFNCVFYIQTPNVGEDTSRKKSPRERASLARSFFRS